MLWDSRRVIYQLPEAPPPPLEPPPPDELLLELEPLEPELDPPPEPEPSPTLPKIISATNDAIGNASNQASRSPSITHPATPYTATAASSRTAKPARLVRQVSYMISSSTRYKPSTTKTPNGHSSQWMKLTSTYWFATTNPRI